MATPNFAADAYASVQTLGSDGITKKAGKGVMSAAMAATGKPDFGGLVMNAVQSLAEKGVQADQQMTAAVKGEANLIDLAKAVTEAETLIGIFAETRNKALQAYQEVLQMNV